MSEPLYFKDYKDFEAWLITHHNTASGTDIYLFKKGYEHLGLTYEEAVRSAVCYGWIDAVTHRCDETKFRQYFAPRRQDSHWSLSNKIRVRDLIKEGRMTEFGLKFFDVRWLDHLEEEIEADQQGKKAPVILPDYLMKVLEDNDAVGLFEKETKSAQRRYVAYIQDAKREATSLRRCSKIVDILKGGKNNL